MNKDGHAKEQSKKSMFKEKWSPEEITLKTIIKLTKNKS